ncbi:MAG: PTS sugar transporter subunit IIA [Candidatus Kapabacteria bacterium]|nr:PTS sugar transporter subunit IIA [Candidatus Kapabacteria bacterium]
MQLVDILSKKSVKLNITVASKIDLFDELLLLASLSGNIRDYELVKGSVIHRENIMTTGLGKGIALPHSKSQGVTKATAALVTLAKPIDYGSFDNIPVSIVVMILSPNENPAIHLSLISKVARFFQDDFNRFKVQKSKSIDELFHLLDFSKRKNK